MQPLDPQALENRYAALGMSADMPDLLRTCFLCFSNLYGVISLRDAWDIFRDLEGVPVRQTDFIAFSDFVCQEPDLPYSLFEQKEIYSGEETDDPLERLIVNNELLDSGENRFSLVYRVDRYRMGRKPFVPDRETFLTFTEDRYYASEPGKELKSFVEGLTSCGVRRDLRDQPAGAILDIRGEPVKGKKLSDIVCLTEGEQTNMERAETEEDKRRLMERCAVPASRKILDDLRRASLIGGYFPVGPASDIEYQVRRMNRYFGVDFSRNQAEHFIALAFSTHNAAHLWQNNGWSPRDLSLRSPGSAPAGVSFSISMKKAFMEGKIDREELIRELREMGLSIDK